MGTTTQYYPNPANKQKETLLLERREQFSVSLKEQLPINTVAPEHRIQEADNRKRTKGLTAYCEADRLILCL